MVSHQYLDQRHPIRSDSKNVLILAPAPALSQLCWPCMGDEKGGKSRKMDFCYKAGGSKARVTCPNEAEGDALFNEKYLSGQTCMLRKQRNK